MSANDNDDMVELAAKQITEACAHSPFLAIVEILGWERKNSEPFMADVIARLCQAYNGRAG